jgi:hypothetical protein
VNNCDIYLDIWRAFEKATISEATERAGLNNLIYIIIRTYILLMLLIIAYFYLASIEAYIPTIIIFVTLSALMVWLIHIIFLTIAEAQKWFASKYKTNIDFFKRHKYNWRGVRFFIFAESIHRIASIPIKSIERMIGAEAKLEIGNITKDPFLRLSLPFAGAIFSAIFTNLSLLVTIAPSTPFLLAFVCYLFFLIFKRNSISEIKQFLVWYDEFGKELMDNLNAKKRKALSKKDNKQRKK